MAEGIVSDDEGFPVTPDLVLTAYWQRCFPMADGRRGRLRWYRPETRAVITWESWKIPESLRKVMRKQPYRITFNQDFSTVIRHCSERKSTWISHDVEQLYGALHARGLVHSVEAWDAGGALVGGLYGLCLGSCFCGESMFHRADDAAKICVVHLVERLQQRGFLLLDCQQQTPHMQRFGALEISDQQYASLLKDCHDARPFP